MNINYLKILDKVTYAKSDIEKLYSEAQKADEKSFEDREAYIIVENFLENLDIVEHRLKRLSLPTVEGQLQEDKELGKFELIRFDTGKSIGWQFSCGDYLEVYDDDGEWYQGRVEHTTKNGTTGYYFYNSDLNHPFLCTGMRCRIRREE